MTVTLCELSRCILDIPQSGRDFLEDMCLLTLESRKGMQPISCYLLSPSMSSVLRICLPVISWEQSLQDRISLAALIAQCTVSLRRPVIELEVAALSTL